MSDRGRGDCGSAGNTDGGIFHKLNFFLPPIYLYETKSTPFQAKMPPIEKHNQFAKHADEPKTFVHNFLVAFFAQENNGQ